MRDIFQEIIASMSRNRLRTCLTGVAVAWGIFMLIVLLGAGNGLVNALASSMEGLATNVMTAYMGSTSKAYGGFESGRRLRFDDSDVSLSKSAFPDITDKVSPSITAGVMRMVCGDRYSSASLVGNYPSRIDVDRLRILHGRFIDDLDIAEQRKVAVIGSSQAEHLLPKGSGIADMIGRRVTINDLSFLVVGVYETNAMDNSPEVILPYSTMRTVFNKSRYVDSITLSFKGIETMEEADAFEDDYRSAINLNHRAAPDDRGTMGFWNRFRQNVQMNQAMNMLTVALWIIGIFTLLSGIVGVSNIMLITVKERTHEFGIRKAIGARPSKILGLILAESVSITAVFGYVGMVLGMVFCEILDRTVGSSSTEVMGEEITMLENITVGVDVALQATLLLVVAGVLAGLSPARRAAKVRPIEALRQE